MDTSNSHFAAADARSDQPTDELHEALAPPDLAFVRKYIEPLCRPLELYHRYSLVHAERLPKTGPVLLVCTHSFASYDLVLLVLSVMQQTGRLARALGHKQLWFFHPIMSALSQRIGVVPGTPDAGHKLLAAGELVADGEVEYPRLDQPRGNGLIVVRHLVADTVADLVSEYRTAAVGRHLAVPVLEDGKSLGRGETARNDRFGKLSQRPVVNVVLNVARIVHRQSLLFGR